MPTQKSGRKKEETKGIIPAAQDMVNTVKKKGSELLFGRKEEQSPGKIAEGNREMGEQIVSTLKTVDFSALKHTEGVSPETVQEMRISVGALIAKIENAPTIFDDITELDKILLKAADTLKTATEHGYLNQAEWCINAISTGLLLLRDNIPPQCEQDRDSILKNRIDYMQNYEKLIIAYGKIDGNNQSIAKAEATLAQYAADYEPLRQQILDMNNTPEGLASIARINANVNQPGKLSDADRQLEIKARRAGDLASSITRLRNQQYARVMDNESQMTIAMGFRTALDNLPQLYEQDLLGDYAVILKDINVKTNKMLTDAAAVLRVEQNASDEMDRIMNGSAAQELTVYAARSIEKLNRPANHISQREMLEASLIKAKQNRVHQLEMENAQRMQQLLQQTQENAQFNEAEQYNFAADGAENTVTQEQTAENTEDQKVYNMNS